MERRLGREVTRKSIITFFILSVIGVNFSEATNWFRGFIYASASMRGNCWFPFPSRTVRSASRCDSDSLLAVDDPKTAFLGFLGFFENRDFWGPENPLRSRSKLLGPFSPNKGDFAVLKGKSGFSFRNPVSPGTPSLPPVFGPPRDPRNPRGPPGPRGDLAPGPPPGPAILRPVRDPVFGPPRDPVFGPPGSPPGGGCFRTPFLGPPPPPPPPRDPVSGTPPPPPPPPRCARRVCAGARTVQKGDFGGVKKRGQKWSFFGKNRK